jgi:hypothetical protein
MLKHFHLKLGIECQAGKDAKMIGSVDISSDPVSES